VRETERKGLGLFARLPIGLHRPGGAGGVDDEWGIEVCGELVSATEGMEREMQYQKQGHGRRKTRNQVEKACAECHWITERLLLVSICFVVQLAIASTSCSTSSVTC
jgi:hypothetical protein